jgi:predicted RNase H-like HicB family nuclease
MKHILVTRPITTTTSGNDNSTFKGKLYDFEVRRARNVGGYWATCKELNANTQAPTMKELEKNIIEVANLMFEFLDETKHGGSS